MPKVVLFLRIIKLIITGVLQNLFIFYIYIYIYIHVHIHVHIHIHFHFHFHLYFLFIFIYFYLYNRALPMSVRLNKIEFFCSLKHKKATPQPGSS